MHLAQIAKRCFLSTKTLKMLGVPFMRLQDRVANRRAREEAAKNYCSPRRRPPQ